MKAFALFNDEQQTLKPFSQISSHLPNTVALMSNVVYRVREGKHSVVENDWLAWIEQAKRIFKI